MTPIRIVLIIQLVTYGTLAVLLHEHPRLAVAQALLLGVQTLLFWDALVHG